MNALFLKYLAHKMRRGLQGRVRQGKSGGGLASVMTWCVSWTLPAKPCTGNAASTKAKQQLSAASSRSSQRATHRERSLRP